MTEPTMTIAEIIAILQEWFADRTGATVDPSAGYIDAASLDSFDVMQLVVFAEARFGFQFLSSDFGNPEFMTTTGLATVIRSRLHGIGPRP